jgi:dTDP-L-rhamnose 4-epimerase
MHSSGGQIKQAVTTLENKRVLVTGGAGFIGCHLVKRLADEGAHVVVLDSLLEQVHGKNAVFPEFAGNVELVQGDIRDRRLVEKTLEIGFDYIYHLAALTGVGQSMYEIEEYVDVNCRGTATLLDAVINFTKKLKKIVLSSSRAVYGEGCCRCQTCNLTFYPDMRGRERLDGHLWEHPCPECGCDSQPVESTESSLLRPTSVYGITKMMQEQLWQTIALSYRIPYTILRYFNVYGPGQSLRNPYTGILSIFSRRLKNGEFVEVYEDGKELRDFVYVGDVCEANLLARRPDITGAINICSGERTNVYDIARHLADICGSPSNGFGITGHYRIGDIRHGIGSSDLARRVLNYNPSVGLRQGLELLVNSAFKEDLSSLSGVDRLAQGELQARGLSD